MTPRMLPNPPYSPLAEHYWGRIEGERKWELIGKHSHELSAALHFAKLRRFTGQRTVVELKSSVKLSDRGEFNLSSLVVLQSDSSYSVAIGDADENPCREAMAALTKP